MALLTRLVTVQLDGTIVNLGHGLDLNVVTVHVLFSLPRNVTGNVLGHKLCEIFPVLGLKIVQLVTVQ